MLQLIRDRAHGVITWLIVGAIVLAFALFGLNSYFSGTVEDFVAKVNDEEISSRDYQQVYARERAFRQSLMGENFNPAFLNESDIKKSALTTLINTIVVSQAADESGFHVGNTQLGQQIQGIQQFQTDGRFDQALYRRLLSSQGLSPGKFEADVRRDMIANQFSATLTDTEFVTSHELDQILTLKEQQRKLGYLVLNADDYKTEVEITDEDIEQYYESNQERYAVPEQVRIDFLELSAANLTNEIAQPAEDELRQLYEEKISDFGVEEERRASHILIKVEDDSDNDQVEAARTKAEELLTRIKAGESFEDLARAYSEDTGSAANGGDLDFFGKGLMVKPFEDAVFTMSIGEVSDLVKSQFGYHIIKLTDINEGKTKSFEEVRDKLAKDFVDQKAEDQFFELVDIITNLTYENPDNLDIAAKELNLDVQSTDYFDRNQGVGLASDARVRNLAFSDDVLEAGNNSEPLELGANRVVVIRLKDRKPSANRPLDEVKDQIREQLRADKARLKAENVGENILGQLKQGGDAKQLAEKFNVEWKETELLGRTDSSIDVAIIKIAFKLKEDAIDGLSLSSGDYAIVQVLEVKDGDLSKLDEAKRTGEMRNVINMLGQRDRVELLENLKSRARIIKYEDRL
ncbi:MAG: SurA N-terminal domain-containing protein [Gammaproteobacteria bacterium]